MLAAVADEEEEEEGRSLSDGYGYALSMPCGVQPRGDTERLTFAGDACASSGTLLSKIKLNKGGRLRDDWPCCLALVEIPGKFRWRP
jgi:hypothetical protein